MGKIIFEENYNKEKNESMRFVGQFNLKQTNPSSLMTPDSGNSFWTKNINVPATEVKHKSPATNKRSIDKPTGKKIFSHGPTK